MKRLSFQVISDIHITETDLQSKHSRQLIRVLEDIRENDPDSAALVIAGDMTDRGMEEEYDGFLAVLKAMPHPRPYFALGNHDIRWHESYEVKRKRFEEKLGTSITYDFWLNGYLFIVLGTDYKDEATLKDHSYISETQLDWLEQKLAERSNPAKPIFVILHQPFQETVAGSVEWHGVVPDAQLRSLLGRYPQVVYFSGHSHAALEMPHALHREKFTMVNTASVMASWNSLTEEQSSQGLYVEVYDDKVLIKGRDFAKKEWVQEAQYSIEFPARESTV